MEKKSNFKVSIHGIKCDACDYQDMSVKMEEYPAYVNKACPKCGENLLTKADFKSMKSLVAFTKILNVIFPAKETETEAEPIILSGQMDGSGVIDFERLKKSEQE